MDFHQRLNQNKLYFESIMKNHYKLRLGQVISFERYLLALPIQENQSFNYLEESQRTSPQPPSDIEFSNMSDEFSISDATPSNSLNSWQLSRSSTARDELAWQNWREKDVHKWLRENRLDFLLKQYILSIAIIFK